MSERARIQEGDKVNVFFATSEMIAGATVLYTPADTGDCWHLREQCGALTYVQQFDKIELVEIPDTATPPPDGGLRWRELKDSPEGKEVLVYSVENGHPFYDLAFREQDTWVASWTPRKLEPLFWIPLPLPPLGRPAQTQDHTLTPSEGGDTTFEGKPPAPKRFRCKGCGATDLSDEDWIHGTHLNYDKHELGDWCGPVEPAGEEK